jgi:hypothetical protein
LLGVSRKLRVSALPVSSKRFDEIMVANNAAGKPFDAESAEPFDYTQLVVENHKRDWVQKPEEKLDLPAWVNRMNRGGKVQGFVAFLLVVKKTGKIVCVSPKCKEILEKEPEELLGHTLDAIFVNTETVNQLLQLDDNSFNNAVRAELESDTPFRDPATKSAAPAPGSLPCAQSVFVF